MENEKYKSDMTFETEGEPVEEQKPAKPKKRKNIFKRIGGLIATGARKVRESPVAAIIGAVGGAGLLAGGEVLYRRHQAKLYATLEIPENEPTTKELMPAEEPIPIQEPAETVEVAEE